jgi:hypothetical protein
MPRSTFACSPRCAAFFSRVGASSSPAARARVERVGLAVLALTGVGMAAASGWTLAGGGVPSLIMLSEQFALGAADVPGGVPVRVTSAPDGAEVWIDDSRRGQTPIVTLVAPGAHTIGLRHPDAVEMKDRLHLTEAALELDVSMWRRRPDVLPLRSVYPGATLGDARFLDDWHVALAVSVPSRSASTT